MRDTTFGENDFDMFGLRLMCLHGRVVFFNLYCSQTPGGDEDVLAWGCHVTVVLQSTVMNLKLHC